MNVGDQPMPPPKRRAGRASLWLTLGAALLAVGLCVLGTTMLWNGPPAGVVDSPVLTTSGVAVAAPSASPLEAGVRDGTWEVGRDVEPGKYRSAGAVPSGIGLCNWSVRLGDRDYVNTGVADKQDQQQLVTLVPGQLFDTRGCKPWLKVG